MSGPSLHKTTALSFVLHLIAFLIAILVLKQSHYPLTPAPYIVNLVSPEILQEADTGSGTEISKTVTDSVVHEKVVEHDIHKKRERANERIAVIAAKKQVERIIRVRSIITLKAVGKEHKDHSETISRDTGKGTALDDYYAKIRREIWQQWIFPSIDQKDLEAIISMKIMKDGSVIIQKIEKSSGNPIFDRSAIRALTKAGPLSPPPHEMEIGVRFSP